jgi:phosphate transport system substrate-binding protein
MKISQRHLFGWRFCFNVYYCKKSVRKSEIILKGTATILVDETLEPVMDDQVAVF